MSHGQLDVGPPLLLPSLVLLLASAVVSRRRPLVVSQAHPLGSLDVEALVHPQAFPALLVASHRQVSLVLPVASSLLDSLAHLAANPRLASTLLPDDNHDNTTRTIYLPWRASPAQERGNRGRFKSLPKSRKSGWDFAALCTIA